MITVDDSLAIMAAAAAARPLPTEEVELGEATGRVLAQAVQADRDLPPFDRSAVDGWACRRADLGGRLRCGAVVAAGCLPDGPLPVGEAVKVMTGAPVPPGSECVVMVEHAQVADGMVQLPPTSAGNISRRGEDLRAGDAVLAPGTLIGPAQVAILATVGCARVRVARRPRVAVIATGSELVAIDVAPPPAAIRDSNSWQVRAQLLAMGAEVRRVGIVPDQTDALTAAVREAQAWADVVVLSGGVSQGDFDLVPAVLAGCGYRLLFRSVAMQPGKPTVFGDDGRGWCVGLPGNPVATLVVCGLLLRPFLDRLMGRVASELPILAALASPLSRRKADRQASYPVVFTAAGQVEPIPYHGSAHVDALGRAHGLVTMPIGVSELPAGTQVHVRLL
jgi:molybdopterin molybdotransferase